MNSIDQYEFWYNIQNITNNLDNLETYKEAKWVENFSFKEKLNYDLQDIDNLLENKIKLKTGVKKKW